MLAGPKIPATHRLPENLLERAKDIAAVSNRDVTSLVVHGLEAEVRALLEEYEKLTGQPVPRRQVVALGERRR